MVIGLVCIVLNGCYVCLFVFLPFTRVVKQCKWQKLPKTVLTQLYSYLLCAQYKDTKIFNRPGVSEAVIKRALSLIHLVTDLRMVCENIFTAPPRPNG